MQSRAVGGEERADLLAALRGGSHGLALWWSVCSGASKGAGCVVITSLPRNVNASRAGVRSDSDEFPGLALEALDSRLVHAAHRVPGAFPSWLARHLAGNVAVFRRARRLVQDERYDIVHAHGALSAALLAGVVEVPVIYTEHDAPPWLCRYRSRVERVVRHAAYRTINASAFRLVDRVGATFAALREDAIRRFGLSPEKITTIANGTNLSVFTAPEITPAERSLDAALRDGGRPRADGGSASSPGRPAGLRRR